MTTNNSVNVSLSGQTGTVDFVGSSSPAINNPTINDSNGNKELNFATSASAVNYLQIANGATGHGVSLTAQGSDSNVSLTLAGLGTGSVGVFTGSTTGFAIFSSVSGSNSHNTNFIFAGTTGVVRNVTFPDTSGTIVLADTNNDISANNFLSGYTTTATAATTTTLTVASTYQQYFTGSTTQTVLLPVTSTLVLGQSFLVVNNSSGIVTVQSSGANTITAMAGGTASVFTCILITGTTAASWNSTYAEIETPVVVSQGGTGDTSFTAYAPICGGTTSTGALQSIASVGSAGQALRSNGAGALPSMQNGGLINVQYLTSGTAATYTATAGTRFALVRGWGGGGGGGGALGASTTTSVAPGGGAGGFFEYFYANPTTATYTIGGGGAGATAGPNTGSTGGTTTFSVNSLSATGGLGGVGAAGVISAGFSAIIGGVGGTGTNGTYNASGSAGGAGIFFSGAGVSGTGGSVGEWGAGGQGRNSVGAGLNASGIGSGGAGAISTTSSLAGGNGSIGLIIVYEYN